jgi:hypothetical protein
MLDSGCILIFGVAERIKLRSQIKAIAFEGRWLASIRDHRRLHGVDGFKFEKVSHDIPRRVGLRDIRGQPCARSSVNTRNSNKIAIPAGFLLAIEKMRKQIPRIFDDI